MKTVLSPIQNVAAAFCTILAIFLWITPVWAAPYVFHFNLDGLRYDTLKKNIEAGRLPNIEKYFVQQGAWYHQAVTVFPSVSPSAYASFYTGLTPDQSGIPFLEWFDRKTGHLTEYLTLGGKKKMERDLKAPSLFETLAPTSTAAIGDPFSLPIFWETGIFHDGFALDRLALKKLQKILQQPTEKWPHFISTALLSSDFLGHHQGPDSKAVDDNLQRFDVFMGMLMQQIAQRNLADQTYLVLTSDHGMHATQKHFDLRKRLRKAGFFSKDFYLSNRGVSTNFLYLLHGDPNHWIPTLLAQPEVEWIAVRDGASTQILSANGEGTVETLQKGGKRLYRYHYNREREDPLHTPHFDEAFHDADFWGPQTVETDFPDGIVQLGNLFRDDRSGDILIQARPPWLFRTDKAGTHGSLSKEDMRIILMTRGPTVKPGPRGFARSTEVYVMIRSWFANAGCQTTP